MDSGTFLPNADHRSESVFRFHSCVSVPGVRIFERVKVPNLPDSGKETAKAKGVRREGESEGRRRQISGLTNRNRI